MVTAGFSSEILRTQFLLEQKEKCNMESHVIETEQKSCYQWNTQVKHGMHVIRNKWKGRHLVGFYSGMQFSKYPRIKKEDMNVACTFLLAINIYNMWAHMHCRFLFDVVLACCCWHCFIKCQQERKLTEADCDCGYCNATVWSSYSHSRNIVIALYHLKKERKRRLYRWCRNTLATLRICFDQGKNCIYLNCHQYYATCFFCTASSHS